MKIKRTISPSAPAIEFIDLLYGLSSLVSGRRYLDDLEKGLKKYFHVRYVFLLSSGKAALTLILQALKGIAKERNKVIIPAYTCFSVPSAILKAGLEIVPCEIDSDNFDFDYACLDKVVDEDTLCIISTHLFGIPSDVKRTIRLCRERCVFVVEDAAQAMGIRYKGKFLGTIGDAGFFSFGRGKAIYGGGGGAIVTDSDEIAMSLDEHFKTLNPSSLVEDMVELLKFLSLLIFINPYLYWIPSGIHFLGLGKTIFYKDFPIKRLSGMRAGLLRNWRKRLEESNAIRRKNAEYFYKELNINGHSIPCLRLPIVTKDLEAKERILKFARKNGLGIGSMYPTPINEIEEIRHFFNGSHFPNAKDVSEHLITLPTHYLLSEGDKEEILGALRKSGVL